MPAGRPTKLTPEAQEAVIRNIVTAGANIETAAAAAGIDQGTLHRWLKRGAREADRVSRKPGRRTRKAEAKYVEFREALQKALGEAETWRLAILAKAANAGVWQAAAWWLERRMPRKYAKAKRELPPEDGGQTQKSWSLQDPETWSEAQLLDYRETGSLPSGPPKSGADG